MCQQQPPEITPAPFDQHADTCPGCGHQDLSYGSSELHDSQMAYPWHCAACGASGKEWHTLAFEEHVLTGAAPATGRLFTVIGEYWDNEQGYCETVRAADEDDAVKQVQALVCASLEEEKSPEQRAEEAEEEDAELYKETAPLRIWAVMAGNPSLIYLRGADEGSRSYPLQNAA